MVFVDGSLNSEDMVRLADDCRGHVYFYKAGEWVKSKNKVLLPEGWVAGGVPKEDND